MFSTTKGINLVLVTDNSSKDVSDNSGTRSAPNLWLLVYDPTISAQEAYESGTAGLTLINANGFTIVTLTPSYMKTRDIAPHYEFNAQVSTTPRLNIVCDAAMRDTALANATTDDAYAPCEAWIALRFARMERQTTVERPAMDWADVIMSAGAYFAFVQLLCWVISGLAWTDAVGRQ